MPAETRTFELIHEGSRTIDRVKALDGHLSHRKMNVSYIHVVQSKFLCLCSPFISFTLEVSDKSLTKHHR